MKVVPVQQKQSSLGIGISYAPGSNEYEELVNYTNLKLATLGLPTVGDQSNNPALKLGGSLV